MSVPREKKGSLHFTRYEGKKVKVDFVYSLWQQRKIYCQIYSDSGLEGGGGGKRTANVVWWLKPDGEKGTQGVYVISPAKIPQCTFQKKKAIDTFILHISGGGSGGREGGEKKKGPWVTSNLLGHWGKEVKHQRWVGCVWNTGGMCLWYP